MEEDSFSLNMLYHVLEEVNQKIDLKQNNFKRREMIIAESKVEEKAQEMI